MTERGVPKWLLVPIQAVVDDRLEELTKQGWVIPPQDNPPPWPDSNDTGAPEYTPEEVDELVRWIKDDR